MIRNSLEPSGSHRDYLGPPWLFKTSRTSLDTPHDFVSPVRTSYQNLGSLKTSLDMRNLCHGSTSQSKISVVKGSSLPIYISKKWPCKGCVGVPANHGWQAKTSTNAKQDCKQSPIVRTHSISRNTFRRCLDFTAFRHSLSQEVIAALTKSTGLDWASVGRQPSLVQQLTWIRSAKSIGLPRQRQDFLGYW